MRDFLFASGDLTIDQLNNLVEILMLQMHTNDPREVVKRINSGAWTITPTLPVMTFTVRLGLENSSENYRKALLNANVRIGMSVGDLLNHIPVSHEQIGLNLVALSAADLGFKNNAKYSKICSAGIELGHKFCPAEAAVALRLNYPDQPSGERLCIAMEAIQDSTDHRGIFVIEHDNNGLGFYGSSGHPDLLWDDRYRFVFEE